jgi:hypothetical protein
LDYRDLLDRDNPIAVGSDRHNGTRRRRRILANAFSVADILVLRNPDHPLANHADQPFHDDTVDGHLINAKKMDHTARDPALDLAHFEPPAWRWRVERR